MNYTVHCKDVVSGEIGCFGFSKADYLAAPEPLQFVAITPVLPSLIEFFKYARENSITVEHLPVTWGQL